MTNYKNFERAVLSAIIFEPQILDNIVLSPSHFTYPFYKNMFSTMLLLQSMDKPISDDFINIYMKKDGTHDEMEMLDVLTANPITNIPAYTDVIKENTRKHRFNIELAKMIDGREKDEDIGVIGEKISSLVEALSSSEDKRINIVDTSLIKSVEPKFLIPDFLPLQEREVNLFSAGGGGGKSFTGLLLLGKIKQTGKKVIGFFSEDDIGVTKNRLEVLRDTYPELPDFPIAGADTIIDSFVSKNDRNNVIASEEFHKFKRLCKNYDVILIDPFIAFYDQDENSNPEVRIFMSLLNRWCKLEDKTIILIHHHSKSGTSRGASALIDAVRLHYTIELFKKSSENNKDEIDKDLLWKRKLCIQKKNHWRGAEEFSIQLFNNPKYVDDDEYFANNGGAEVIEYSMEDVEKADLVNRKIVALPKDEGVSEDKPKEWSTGIDSFMKD